MSSIWYFNDGWPKAPVFHFVFRSSSENVPKFSRNWILNVHHNIVKSDVTYVYLLSWRWDRIWLFRRLPRFLSMSKPSERGKSRMLMLVCVRKCVRICVRMRMRLVTANVVCQKGSFNSITMDLPLIKWERICDGVRCGRASCTGNRDYLKRSSDSHLQRFYQIEPAN